MSRNSTGTDCLQQQQPHEKIHTCSVCYQCLYRVQNKKNKIINDNGENKNCRHGLDTRVKSTKIGLKETEESKACTRLICKELYGFV